MIPGGIILNLFLTMFLQFIWGLLNDMSFIMILSLVSLNVPGPVQLIQSTMLNFIYMDILQTSLWLDPIIFNSPGDNNDDGINPFFDLGGFTSMILIKNLGSTFVFLIVLLIAFCSMFIIKLMSIRFKT